jgi:hypothetical protein
MSNVTKTGLLKAAGRCFKAPIRHMWWGYDSVTNDDEWVYVRKNLIDVDYDSGAYKDGEYSVWLLLLAAEFIGSEA